ncbi:LiaI-LiaF-like domain-containing protein [Ectobacillus ponti]|uniref:DUF5668 domain-containing protein n=1 Tax=Ectobacillus ponti TaxID=2961894 RepID=A0AA42BNW6_9BACI|nr:DUF5668 domain-containing protein [Ectobacillus ponti]MCP8967781.1 DUF5668 domain-containing protein [Ectobacillus ponti]
MDNTKRYLSGLVLVAVGLLFFLRSLGIMFFDFGSVMEYGWPFILLLVSLGFHIAFFASGMNPRRAGLLVPGGVLLVLSLLFIFEAVTGWRFAGQTWPVYMLAPAVGLFELYVFGGRQRTLLIPVAVLSIVSLSFLAQMALRFTFEFWPLLLVAVGVWMLTGRGRKRKEDDKLRL